MQKPKTLTTDAILERAAALRQEAEYLERLAGTTGAVTAAKRTLSAAGRAAISRAQHQRRAAHNGSRAPAAPSHTARRLTPAARRRISEATKKRWAAYRAQKATTARPAARPKTKAAS